MRAKRSSATPTLAPNIVAVVLCGWGVKFDDAPLDFDFFCRREKAVIETWNRHREFLISEARRRDIKPPFVFPDGRRLFFAELVQLPLDEQAEAENLRWADGNDAA